MPSSETNPGGNHERSGTAMDMLHLIDPKPAPITFDYTSLPSDLAERQRERASRIVGILRRTVEAAGEIGRELLAAQAELEHGQFLRWVEDATSLSKSSAYRFMDIASTFGDRLPTVGSLPLTVIHKLAEKSTPEPVRAAVLSRIEAGETVQPREILAQVREARDAARKHGAEKKEAARRDCLTPEQRDEEDAVAARGEKGRAARERKEERIRQEQQRERKERSALVNEAAETLVDALGADAIVAYFARFKSVSYDGLSRAENLAHIRRAEREVETEIQAKEVERFGMLYGSIPVDDCERMEALAQEIKRNGLSEPLIVAVQPGARTYPYRLLRGHDAFRALTEILDRQVIPVRIAPAVEAEAAASLDASHA